MNNKYIFYFINNNYETLSIRVLFCKKLTNNYKRMSGRGKYGQNVLENTLQDLKNCHSLNYCEKTYGIPRKI